MDVSTSLSNFQAQIGELLPGVLGALLVLLIGLFLARGIRGLANDYLPARDLMIGSIKIVVNR